MPLSHIECRKNPVLFIGNVYETESIIGLCKNTKIMFIVLVGYTNLYIGYANIV